MTQEIATRQKVILMKSGLALWVSEERATKLEEILANSEGHRFIKLDDKMINSAEIDGIYTTEKYDDINKLKEGMRQCSYLVWHKKREECSCASDVREKLAFVKRLKHRLETENDLDKTQKESMEQYYIDGMKWLKERGIETNL